MKAGLLALALLFGFTPSATAQTEEQCLASAIFYEANMEPWKGKRAVLDVILNRMKATGKTACQVIKAKAQFSWVGLKPMKKYNKKMQEMLTRVINMRRILNNEKFFFSTSMLDRPRWARRMECRQIARHFFCKEKTNVQKRR